MGVFAGQYRTSYHDEVIAARRFEYDYPCIQTNSNEYKSEDMDRAGYAEDLDQVAFCCPS